MVLSLQGDVLYVVSVEGFKNVQGGVVYILDLYIFNIIGLMYIDLKNFVLQFFVEGKMLYVSNLLDGGISVIDIVIGKVKNCLLFSECNEKGCFYGVCQLLLLNNIFYVGVVVDLV